MSDEIVIDAWTGVLTNGDSCAGIVCNFTGPNNRFTRAGDLDTGILHATYPHVRDLEIRVCDVNSNSRWTENVETDKMSILNVLSRNRHIGGENPCAMELGAHHRNATP